MEAKIIELLDQEKAFLFRKGVYLSRKNSTIKLFTLLQHETVITCMRVLNGVTQEGFSALKKLLEFV